MLDDCRYLAAFADETAQKKGINDQKFVENLQDRFQARAGSPDYGEFRAGGFKSQFKDEAGSYNQVRHFVGTFAGGFHGGLAVLVSQPLGSVLLPGAVAKGAVAAANRNENSLGDRALNEFSVRGGVYLSLGKLNRSEVGNYIRNNVCDTKRKN